MINTHFPDQATEAWRGEVTWSLHLLARVIPGIRKPGEQQRCSQQGSSRCTVPEDPPLKEGCSGHCKQEGEADTRSKKEVKMAGSQLSAGQDRCLPLQECLAP